MIDFFHNKFPHNQFINFLIFSPIFNLSRTTRVWSCTTWSTQREYPTILFVLVSDFPSFQIVCICLSYVFCYCIFLMLLHNRLSLLDTFSNETDVFHFCRYKKKIEVRITSASIQWQWKYQELEKKTLHFLLRISTRFIFCE